MSFLTPLYLLGGLAIALPILAHLIRRTPPRRREFSSVMFLTPSQPTVTRRSRIEHWPLLCLRALAIILLAIAFARPLWRTTVLAEELPHGKWTAVLLDTSASMNRNAFWDSALVELENILNAAEPADRIGVFTFDSQTRLISGWDEWSALAPAQRTAAVLDQLSTTHPGWQATDLGQALLVAAESLEAAADPTSPAARREIAVISDLQSGSRLNALQGHVWPENMTVRLVRIGADAADGNAALQPAIADDGTIRLRVTNAGDATQEEFEIEPALVAASTSHFAESATTSGQLAPLRVVVPAGQSRIVRAPPLPPEETAALFRLIGDWPDFDNSCFVIVPRPQKLAIAYLGEDSASDSAGMRFYLQPLFSNTPRRDVELVDWDQAAGTLPTVAAPVRLVVLTSVPTTEQISTLQGYVRNGGLLIQVLSSPHSAETLARIAEISSLPATEADVNGFSLLTDIDFSHPALAPFSDPKYSDFTKLHFWKHRRVDASAATGLNVLARFDDGDLAIGELPVGKGRIVFFTSGWSKADSQLAVWSKFVPLMNGLLESAADPGSDAVQLTVDDPLPWRGLAKTSETTLTLVPPDGVPRPLESADSDDVRADAPGIYTVYNKELTERRAAFAVNLAASESQTSPLEMGQFEALGIPMAGTTVDLSASESEAPHELAAVDLEQRQRLWRWVLFAVIAMLVVETAYAGWLTARHT